MSPTSERISQQVSGRVAGRIGVLSVIFLGLLLISPLLSAQTYDPDHITFTLQGCNLDHGATFDQATGLCTENGYGTGNMGKSWAELDLVPHRVTLQNGNGDQTYKFIVAGDYRAKAGDQFVGWDDITGLKLNAGLSTGPCPVELTISDLSITPPGSGVGGADQTIYREVTITQPAGTTCTYDYAQRLALGASNFSGSSLQSNLWNQHLDSSGIGEKRIQLPVADIAPQVLSKTMSATQDQDVVWNITKAATPVNINFGDTCGGPDPLPQDVALTITWYVDDILPGLIHASTTINVKNPSHRDITVNLCDTIYSAENSNLDTYCTEIVVPANTTSPVTHTFAEISSGNTGLCDNAVATYKDTLTGVSMGEKTASACAGTVGTGEVMNASATVTDVESISGDGLTFKAHQESGVPGIFNADWTLWTSEERNYSDCPESSPCFAKLIKTVSLTDPPVVTSGKLEDTATVEFGSKSAEAKATVDIKASALFDLTVTKTIPNILEEAETASFGFKVCRTSDSLSCLAGGFSKDFTLEFTAGQTSKSEVMKDLEPGLYLVAETSVPTGWAILRPQVADLTELVGDCVREVIFANDITARAEAQVKKVTVPAGYESGWQFNLSKNGNVLETVTTSGVGYVIFKSTLGQGSYSITEVPRSGWENTGTQGDCAFTVDYPGDAGKTFSCEFDNTFKPSITLEKTGDALSKVGDPIDYTITLKNTSAVGGPPLDCTLNDSVIGFAKTVTLASGGSDTSSPSFTVPVGAADPFVNTVNAECTHQGGGAVVASGTASHSTNLFQPSISLSKTADKEKSYTGDTVNYTIALNNTSSADSPALICMVTDAKLGINKSVTLASGLGDVTEVAYTVQSSDADPLVNTASVSCSPEGFPNVLTQSASATVNLIQPSIELNKSGDTLSKIGDEVTYTFTLKNTSSADTPELSCTISDDKLGPLAPLNVPSGGTVVKNVTYTVPPGASDPLENTASVTCSPSGFAALKVTASDSHSVNLFQPSVALDKVADNPYSKVGDVVNYTITLNNTSSADSPDLVCTVTDAKLAINKPVTLASGSNDVTNVAYTVQGSDPDPLVNTASVACSPSGFPNVLSAEKSVSIDLVQPAFTVVKECFSSPAPQDGPAVFTVTLTNTGTADLVVKASEPLAEAPDSSPTIAAGDPIALPIGAEKTYYASVAGPFTGQETVANTITGTVTLDPKYGLSNSYDFSAGGSCVVGGEIEVLKTTDGQVDPAMDWPFKLSTGGKVIAMDTTLNDADGILFDDLNLTLSPALVYTLCENAIPAGWTSVWTTDWMVDGQIITPYNPDAPLEDLGNRCYDFGYGKSPAVPAGGLLEFTINNSFPGGEPRTIGYWKNWNRCSNGNQADTAAKNGGPDAGWYLLEDLLPKTVGGLTFDDCETGVSILEKRRIDTGKKRANDPLYGLAAQLLAAKLNLAAGAETCPDVLIAVSKADLLLAKYFFNGAGVYTTKLTYDDAQKARRLAGKLDRYNNGYLCP